MIITSFSKRDMMGKKSKRQQQRKKHYDKYGSNIGVSDQSFSHSKRSDHTVRFDNNSRPSQNHSQNKNKVKHKTHNKIASQVMMTAVIEEVFGPTRNYHGSLSENR